MRTRLAARALAAAALLVAAAGCSSQLAASSAGTPLAAPGSATVPAEQAASASHPCGTQAEPGPYRHVIWIWMENHSSGTIIGSAQAPYLSTLAGKCGLATNYHNITHPSLG